MVPPGGGGCGGLLLVAGATQQRDGVVGAQGDGGALGCRVGLPAHKVEQRDVRLALAAVRAREKTEAE